MLHCGEIKLRNNNNNLFHCQGDGAFGGLSHAELIGNCPSPREEGVGERVQLREKINPSLKIVSFRKRLKDNFSLSLGESSSYSNGFFKKCAFTLAEVLITLGVIGVVAAITIPGLMTKYRHHVMETKLAKFDSIINQAVRMSIAENGDIFYEPPRDKDTNATYLKEWFDENLLRYMKADYEGDVISNRYYKVNLLDGSGFVAYMTDGGDVIHFFYCINSSDKACKPESYDGKNTFVFNYSSSDKAVVPYGSDITDIQTLKYSTTVYASGCYNKNYTYHHYCAQLIKLNGWKIPKDYPW